MRIFNAKIECSDEVKRLKSMQKQYPLRPEVIPPELANSSQWIVWSYEIAERKNGKFGPDKIPYQARRPWLNSSRWNASDWSDLTTALQCAKDNPHIDGIGYFFSKHDGLIGVDFDNCRDPETGKIRKEYQFWIDRLNGYTEVSPSGTGIKVWVKGTIDSKYFRNDESTGFRIPNFADGIIEIYRRGQYFTVTTQCLEEFEHIRPAQEELDVLSEFYHSRTLNTSSGDWRSGEHQLNRIEVLPKGAKARLGKDTISDIQFSPDGTRLAVAKGIGIWIYDADTGKELFLLSQDTLRVRSVVFHPNGNQLISGTEDGTICLWNVRTGTHEKIHTMNNVRDVIFSPSRTTVATLNWANSLCLWDITTGNLYQTVTANIGTDFLTAVFSPDESMIAINENEVTAPDENCPINLWDTTTGKRLKTLTVVRGKVYSMAFSPDGLTLVNDGSIFEDHNIYLWDIATGKHLKTFTGHKNSVHSLTFSPDGGTLVSGHSDSTIYLWNITTSEPMKTLTGHIGSISSLCFSPDGRTLASGSVDGTVLLWNIDTDSNKANLVEGKPESPKKTFQIDSTHVNVTKAIHKAKRNAIRMLTRAQIQQICTERGITTLVHFTRIENLRSILWEGLLGRSLLEARGQQFLFNDEDRADSNKEAVCLSISFPNYQMFYSITKVWTILRIIMRKSRKVGILS